MLIAPHATLRNIAPRTSSEHVLPNRIINTLRRAQEVSGLDKIYALAATSTWHPRLMITGAR